MRDNQGGEPAGAGRDRAHRSSRADAERLDRVFGTVLPETTSDERDDDGRSATGTADSWFLENRPPHH